MAKRDSIGKLEKLSPESLLAYSSMVDQLVAFYESQIYVDGGVKETKDKYFMYQKIKSAIFDEIEHKVQKLNEDYALIS